MTIATALLVLAATALTPPAEPEHARNALYRSLLESGWAAAAAHVVFPPPLLTDGIAPEAEQAALRQISGSERGAAELTRDSVTAPLVLRTHDTEASEGVIRQADLWFVVRARLADIDPAKAAGSLGEGRPAEAGNMRFTARRLTAEELAGRKLGTVAAPAPALEWFVHSTGRLLDRLAVEATDRVTASRSRSSWAFASQTDACFDHDGVFPNRWQPITRQGSTEEAGAATVYAGGAGTVKVSELGTVPGALLVEAHFAFFEPKGWFDGAPILRSKIGLVAQDRVRSLRRELAKSRKE